LVTRCSLTSRYTPTTIVALGNAVREQALIMGFSDTFAVIGFVLALAAVAILFTRKVQTSGAAAAH
jgi:DHA2 family multidrug resistance protein